MCYYLKENNERKARFPFFVFGIYIVLSHLFPADRYLNMLLQNTEAKRTLASSFYCSPTFCHFHKQFPFFIHVAYSAGQVLLSNALNVVDLQFTADGHHPIGVADLLLCRSRIEQLVPGDGGFWEANSITDSYQVTFRNVVMDRCIETFQHTNETIHHHHEHLVISRANPTGFTLSPMVQECKKSSLGQAPPITRYPFPYTEVI